MIEEVADINYNITNIRYDINIQFTGDIQITFTDEISSNYGYFAIINDTDLPYINVSTLFLGGKYYISMDEKDFLEVSTYSDSDDEINKDDLIIIRSSSQRGTIIGRGINYDIQSTDTISEKHLELNYDLYLLDGNYSDRSKINLAHFETISSTVAQRWNFSPLSFLFEFPSKSQLLTNNWTFLKNDILEYRKNEETYEIIPTSNNEAELYYSCDITIINPTFFME